MRRTHVRRAVWVTLFLPVALATVARTTVPASGSLPNREPAVRQVVQAEVVRRLVVVRPGDTLWSIAATVAARGEDPRQLVDELVSLNGMRDAQIYPGQVLALP